ncbi:MAG: hypothetical protein K0Q87_1237 [Neobacillus sp.]|jgi:hypothetical protein|nr:hypothetical protein [Neobacillus sp.]
MAHPNQKIKRKHLARPPSESPTYAHGKYLYRPVYETVCNAENTET